MSRQQALGPPVRRPERIPARPQARASFRAIVRALPLAILLLSAALIWYDLGDREVLGRDENVTIVHVDQPGLGAVLDTIGIKFTGQPGNMQPLYFLLQHLAWPLVGHSAFVLRFLPSAFGILAVAVALLAGGNPLGVIASALFFSALKAGGATMSIQTGVGAPMTIVIEALCVIFVIGVGYSERKRLKRLEKADKEDEEVKQHVG